MKVALSKKTHVYSGFIDCILSVTGCADKEIVDDVGVSFRIIDKNDDDNVLINTDLINFNATKPDE